MQTNEKKPPEGGVVPVFEFSIERGGVFFPVYAAYTLPEGQRFMLRYTGQMCQLLTTSLSTETSTPQFFCPEQATKETTGGNPCLTCRSKVETVTVLLATAQSTD